MIVTVHVGREEEGFVLEDRTAGRASPLTQTVDGSWRPAKIARPGVGVQVLIV